MHKFNPSTEPATVLVEVNPRRYATVAHVDDKGKVVRQPNGRDASFMLHVIGTEPGKESRMWVPPRIAKDLTSSSPGDSARGIPPVARIVESRTVEEAKGVITTKPVEVHRKKD